MLFNKNIILEILQSNFWNKIESYIDEYIMELEPYELEQVFDFTVDYGLMDGIGEIVIEEYHVEQTIREQLVSGIFSTLVSVEGYTHWEKENVFVGVEEIELVFYFSFLAQDEKVFDLELTLI